MKVVLITYMGGPSKLSEIRDYLYRLFSDKDMIDMKVPYLLQKFIAKVVSFVRTPLVKKHYEEIGGSPVVKNVLELSKLVEKALSIKTIAGMLYSKPFLEDSSKVIRELNPEEVFVVSLYPQYSHSTVGASFKKVKEFLKGFTLKFVNSWHLNPFYLEWIRENIRTSLKGLSCEDTVILFSAHSLPVYMVEKYKDPYPKQVEETARFVMKEFPEFRWKLAYQSKLGPVKWLSPSVEEALLEVKKEGYKNVVFFPISFVCEHLETLYEIDVEYKKLAEELSLRLFRTPLDHTSENLVKAIVSEVKSVMTS